MLSERVRVGYITQGAHNAEILNLWTHISYATQTRGRQSLDPGLRKASCRAEKERHCMSSRPTHSHYVKAPNTTVVAPQASGMSETQQRYRPPQQQPSPLGPPQLAATGLQAFERYSGYPPEARRWLPTVAACGWWFWAQSMFRCCWEFVAPHHSKSTQFGVNGASIHQGRSPIVDPTDGTELGTRETTAAFRPCQQP